MKAGIDLDGVIADLMTPLLKEVNKRFYHNEGALKNPLKYEDITSYHFADCVPVDIEDLRVIWENPEFIWNQPLLPWAKWGVNRLRDFGYEIYIITARKSHFKSITLSWLIKNDIYYDDIVTGKWEEKQSYIERNNLDIFIDDRTSYVLDATEFCKRVYLMDTPYNRYTITPDESKSNIIRVNNWRDIIKKERGFLNESDNLRGQKLDKC